MKPKNGRFQDGIPRNEEGEGERVWTAFLREGP
jgi:hypothetical protein